MTDRKVNPLLGIGTLAFRPTSMEGVMGKIIQSMAVLVLTLIGLVGCDYEARAVRGANPVRVAEMRQTFRDLWLGHIYWMQHAIPVSYTHLRAHETPEHLVCRL